ncbi:non-ribosomal peptide synthetase [Nonomuraea lactucae]|uniref:non-ribosomal peptide synthetase n=1 Tax=Nonomuraea lactucae TaxID=2249762 RepID=UPI0019635227|nr:non-ribosomal peptide synthetase [Nonomuraea lactucae]
MLAEQGTVTGTVPLTPIQHWFSEQDITDRDHWNWSGMFELAPDVDSAALARALDAVVAHHDALRMRLVYDPAKEEWVQRDAAVEEAEVFSVVDAAGTDEAWVVEWMTVAQKSLSLVDGPLIRAVHFDRGAEPGWLGVTVHHLVMDGVSWNVLLEDLDRAYRGEPLPPKTTSFQQWAEKLRSYAASDEVRAQLPYWERQLEGFAVPVDNAEGANTEASTQVVRVTLDTETTAALLTRAHRAYRTQINDLLLAALLRALGEWAGTDAVTIDLESHGREAIAEEIDLSRTVGWFTSIFPVRLSAAELTDPADVLKSVKEQLRAVPRRGVGYGALRYLAGQLPQAQGPQVVFNYMGAADVAGDDTVTLLARELPHTLAGPNVSLGRNRSHLLQIEATQTADGRMAFEWYYSANLHHQATVERVANAYAQALSDLVSHCLSPEAGGHTPSDFPLARLDQRTLDALGAGAGHIQDVYPLAPVQQGMLFHTLEAPANATGVYLAQGVYEFTGGLDVAAFRRAWDDVVERHPALRTGFVWEGVEEPVQIVYEKVRLPFEVLDWSGIEDLDTYQARLKELMAKDWRRGMDVAAAPLLRVTLIDRGAGDYSMLLTFHHICMDGWSVSTMLSELSQLYEGATRSAHESTRPALPPAQPYRSFVEWLQRQDAAEAEEFWRGYLAGLEAPTPLPVDRQATEHWTQDRRRLELPVEVTESLVRLARRARVTPGTVVQAAWALLLSRYSGDGDVVFGLTVSGRPAELSGMESMVGLFINTLPLRARVPAETPFIDWLREMQDGQIAMQRFESTALSDIQRCSPIPRGTSLFDSIMVFGNFPQEEVPEEVDPDTEEGAAFAAVESVEQTNYPITFTVDLEERLRLEAIFSVAAFDGTTVERLLDQLGELLASAAAHPEAAVRDVRLQSETARRRLLVDWNDTPEVGAADATLTERFGARVSATPDKCAIRCDGQELTYAELDRRSAQVATALLEQGVTAGSRVGLYFERSAEFVVALLGVARAGASYVPLEPTQPKSRLRYLVENAGVGVVVAGADWPRELDSPAVRVVDLKAAGRERTVQAPVVRPDSALYVMYTSGSTGVPKGVEVTHQAVARVCLDPTIAVEPGDVVAHMAPISFDASTFEIWAALLNGATLAIAPAEQIDVGAFLRQHEVTVAWMTAGLFHQIAETAPETFEGLRMLLAGGDALSVSHCGKITSRFPRLRFVNGYGPTECTVFSALYDLGSGLPPGEGVVPIGAPPAATRVYVLDQWLNTAPVGVPGELFVGGLGLGRGYVGRPDLTAERFVADPFGPAGERLYRTGDRVRWRADGVLEFLGRVDDQVKIRGFRIEPGEVEAVLAEHPQVRDAVVVARADGPSGKRLIGYVVPHTPVDTAELRAFMRERVPEYMVPALFVVVHSFPLTANGKVDRRALPEPDAGMGAGAEFAPPVTDVEVALAGIWSQVLGVERVGLHDNFFELGGDSILSLQIVARARAAGLELDIADVFARQSVGELAAVVRESAAVVLADQGVVSGRVPLTPIQHWFVDQDMADRDHWNWSGMFELAPGADAGALARAVDAVVAHHDALRIRFAYDPALGTWVQRNAPQEDAHVFSVVDAAGMDEAEVVERMTALHKSLSLADGPLLRVALFERGDLPSRLGIIVHHLVMDGVSWNVLLEDLNDAYEGRPLPEKTTSFKRWSEELRAFAASDGVRDELPYWLEQLDGGFDVPLDGPLGAPRDLLPGRGSGGADQAADANTQASTGIVRVWLDAEATSALLTRVHKAYRTQINDLLLAALLQALGGWAGTDAVTVDLESHGREAVAEGVDLSRTVGWFTSIFPVRLSAADLRDPAEVLKSVKEQLRSSPRRGVGYGALRHLTDAEDAGVRRLRSLPDPQVSFNYLGGRSGDGEPGLLARALPAELTGLNVGTEQSRSHVLQVEAAQTDDGRMQFEWYYSGNLHREETVRRVAESYADALRRLIEHCLSPQAGGFTPSDFPLAGLDAESLAAIMKQSDNKRP